MKFIADLHIHSHFSRATSRDLNPENLSVWAQKKGVTLVGTGDFTHPGWVAEIKERLVEAECGFYQLSPDLKKTVDSLVPASCLGQTLFVPSGEISCIYKKNGLTRKVHHLILMPDMNAVERLNERLERIGNIHSDGRPILGLDSRDLLEITLEASDKALFIPAHIWTPWFSVFGSKSGFDSLEECFGDLTGHIHALETGLSSDPPMNRLLSTLDDYILVSNSDAHSPSKLGREANIFDTGLNYIDLVQAMTNGKGFTGTIEFFPEEGKYHLDGHRKCQVRLDPSETMETKGLCPVCGKPLTVGVLNRVNELSDRNEPGFSKAFFSLIPLAEILSQILECGPSTKRVSEAYERLLSQLGPELHILMDVSLKDIEATGGPVLAEAINRMRTDKVIRIGGYDGEYGSIRLFEDSEKQTLTGQLGLFAMEEKKKARPSVTRPVKQEKPKSKEKKSDAESDKLTDPILDPLNEEQRTAVCHDGGYLLVVAGPGTGKTTTLTHRIAHLIRQGVAPAENILALTFTRKAAGEMAERISRLIKNEGAVKVYVSTFHAFCLDVLREHGERIGIPQGFTLCSEADAEVITKGLLVESGAQKRVLNRFVKALPEIRTSFVMESDESIDQEMVRLLEIYQRRLRAMGMLDLDELEIEVLRLFRDHADVAKGFAARFPWIFVDEYQDTNPVQVGIIKCIAGSGPVTLCAIGDPDQAIYGFRGADVKNFLGFGVDFPGVREVMLEKNYRSTEPVLKGSAAVMGKRNSLQCQRGEGEPISVASCITDAEEAEMIVEQVERLIGGTTYFSLDSGRVASHEGEESLSLGDIAVLYRLNSQGDALEKALNRAGIPFIRSGEKPLITRYPVNVIWRFLQTLVYPDNGFYKDEYHGLIQESKITKSAQDSEINISSSLISLVDQAMSFHGLDGSDKQSSEAIKRLKLMASGFDGNLPSFLDMLCIERGIDHAALIGDRVSLMSLHAAKGLEWPVVFITGCEDRLLPCSLFGDQDDQEEERRLFYVGMTRAQQRLILSHVKRRSMNGRVLDMKPSPFLEAIPKDMMRALDRGGWKPKKRPYKQLELF
jgi:DNA helicase-2/ATP-dependent DNA helicase PcrA